MRLPIPVIPLLQVLTVAAAERPQPGRLVAYLLYMLIAMAAIIGGHGPGLA